MPQATISNSIWSMSARIGSTLVALALALCVVFLAAKYSFTEPVQLSSYQRWDSWNYLAIAQTGYTLRPCNQNSSDMCGNAGWFPLYPLTIAIGHEAGLTYDQASVAIPLLFYSLLIISCLLITKTNNTRASDYFRFGLLLALFPGNIYFLAAFPTPLLTCLALWTIIATSKERWALGCFLAWAASFSHPSGLFLGIGLSAWALTRYIKQRKFLLATFMPAIFSALGLASVMLVHYMTVGDARAFFKVQSSSTLGRRLSDPIRFIHHAFVLPIEENILKPKTHRTTYSLRLFDGSFLGAVNGGGDVLVAGAQRPVGWESFEEIPVENGKVVIETDQDKYLQIIQDSPNKDVRATESDRAKAARFTKQSPSWDRISFATESGTFLGIDKDGPFLSANATTIGPRELFEPIYGRDQFFRRGNLYPALQSILVLILLIGCGTIFIARPAKRQTTDSLVLSYAVSTWGISILFGAGLSLYRVEAALVPLVLLLNRLPKAAAWLLIAAFALISFPMAVLFFQQRLI